MLLDPIPVAEDIVNMGLSGKTAGQEQESRRLRPRYVEREEAMGWELFYLGTNIGHRG